jgi:serine-type D-Ala-D-Ala endopeptidase (penicillin-binding protein 7)
LAPESTALTTSNRPFLRRLLTPCLTLCLLVAVPLASHANDKEAARKANAAKKPAAQQTAKNNTKTATKPTPKVRKVAKNNATEPRASFGRVAGLHQSSDALDLRSSVALVIDQDTHEVLLRKNDHAVLPIASLTKLMTALVINDGNLSPHEMITITQEDVDTEKGSTSRLAVGSVLSRGDLLHLALMSSENRAAHALGRTYPNGLSAFVKAMNDRAQGLGMNSSHFVEPTGLSSKNQSSASDLALLVSATYNVPLLRELSTSPGREVAVGRRTLQYNTTNRLVKSPNWDIGLQKTGLHLRSRSVFGHADQSVGSQAHHGVLRFSRQVKPNC